MTTSIDFGVTLRETETANVAGILRGSDPELAEQVVVFSAHHDHFGIGEPDATGDDIYNGALDNGVAMAQVLAIASEIERHLARFLDSGEAASIDLRSLPNPYWSLELRGLTGRDEEVIRFLDEQPAFRKMFNDILVFLNDWIPEYESVNRGYLTVACGCTGGQHRSVYMADKLAQALRESHDQVMARHNVLSSHSVSDQ